MFSMSSNGNIAVHRGDTFSLPVLLNIGTTMDPLIYAADNNTYIYLGVMEPNQPFEVALIKKKCTVNDVDDAGYVNFQFNHQDTECVLSGKYYYQVKIQQFHDDTHTEYDVYTLTNRTQFYVLE